jgi:hypothetical protein
MGSRWVERWRRWGHVAPPPHGGAVAGEGELPLPCGRTRALDVVVEMWVGRKVLAWMPWADASAGAYTLTALEDTSDEGWRAQRDAAALSLFYFVVLKAGAVGDGVSLRMAGMSIGLR